MLSLSDNNQTDIIEAFNSTARYIHSLFKSTNPYLEQMVGQIYPNKQANSSCSVAPLFGLRLA